VLTVPQALDLEQVGVRQLLQEFDHVPGADRGIKVARTGFKLSAGDPQVSLPPPVLGAHTDELLAEIGYSPQEIAALRAQGTV
jgi:crotonobetainyl-CoA:carnitine CoA-transferase CaiB-like acyl-CoA transferase